MCDCSLLQGLHILHKLVLCLKITANSTISFAFPGPSLNHNNSLFQRFDIKLLDSEPTTQVCYPFDIIPQKSFLDLIPASLKTK